MSASDIKPTTQTVKTVSVGVFRKSDGELQKAAHVIAFEQIGNNLMEAEKELEEAMLALKKAKLAIEKATLAFEKAKRKVEVLTVQKLLRGKLRE